jgi:CheY-like chemotaxis protein
MGTASLVLEEVPPDVADEVKRIIESSEAAANLTRQLLAYAGKGQFHLESLQLSDVLQETMQLLATAVPKDVGIELDLAPGLPRVRADRGQMQQVMMNLVLNAAEAMAEHGGAVTIRTAHCEIGQGDDGSRWVATAIPAPGSYVSLEVSDRGMGMPADTMARIFDPFFSTKATGRGLGLPAVLGVVRAQGGGLAVQSRPGYGTTFTVLFEADASLQVVEPCVPDEAELLVPERNVTRQPLILVIDDEAPVRDALSDVLDLAGYRVVTAADGRDGLLAFLDLCPKVDLVILDMLMPGMGGDETLRAIRQANPRVKVILSSGYDEAETVRRLAARQISEVPTEFLQKPYGLPTVLAKVKQCLSPRASTALSEPGPIP